MYMMPCTAPCASMSMRIVHAGHMVGKIVKFMHVHDTAWLQFISS